MVELCRWHGHSGEPRYRQSSTIGSHPLCGVPTERMFPGLRFSLLHQLAIRRGSRTVAEETGDTDRHQQPGGGRRWAASWSRRQLMPAEAAVAVRDVEVRTLGKLRRRIIPLLVLL